MNFIFLNVLGFSGWVGFFLDQTAALLEIARPRAKP